MRQRLLDELARRLAARDARTGLLAVAAVAARLLNDWGRAGGLLSRHGARGSALLHRLLHERDVQEDAAGRQINADPQRAWDAPFNFGARGPLA